MIPTRLETLYLETTQQTKQTQKKLAFQITFY